MSHQPADFHPRERERLEALYRYAILDTEAEKGFDDLTKLAAIICGTPISMVSLIDRDRQWFKSKVGIEASTSDRSVSFCAHAIHGSEVFQIPDATLDERFSTNPLVTGEPHVEFYAGAPLTTPEGLPIGTLCVIDHKPRNLTDFQKEALQILATQVISLLELRVKVRELNHEMWQHEKAEQLLRDRSALIHPDTITPSSQAGQNQKSETLLADSAVEGPRSYLPTAALMIVLFLATLLITARSRTLVERENEQLWERQRDGITVSIRDRLAAYAELLRGGEALFASSDSVTPKDWSNYVRHVAISDRYPGVNAVGYVPRVRKADLPAFEEGARKTIGVGFRVRPAGDRDEYYPVLYMEPPIAAVAVGFDIGSEPVRRQTAERSRDLGEPVISRRTSLVQDVERRAGFVMFHPIYSGEQIPTTPAERRANHVGWVYAGFRTDQLLKAIFSDHYPNVLVDIYDGTGGEPSSALYLDPNDRTRIRRTETMPLRFYGRDWTVVISSTRNSASSEPWIVFISGCVITLLAGATALTLSNTRRRAMILADAMSNAYQASERRTRAIVDNVADAIVTFTDDGKISSTNRAAEKLFGARPSELLTMNLKDLFEVHKPLLSEVRDFETLARTRSGLEFEVEASVTKVADSDPPAMIAVVRDIAARKRTVREAALLQSLTVSVAEAEDLGAALEVTLREVCSVTAWPYGEAWLPGRDGLLHRGPAWHTDDEKLRAFDALSLRKTFRAGEGFPGRVFSEGMTASSYDLASDATFVRLGAAQDAGLNAAVGFPVIADEEVIAIILFYARSLSQRDQRFVDLISWMATQLGTVISRKRAEDALKGSEARTRSILKNMLGGLITMHRSGSIESVNPAAEQFFGYREAELIGKPIAKLLSGAQQDPDAFMRSAYERAIGKVTEWQGARSNGSSFPFELSLFQFSTTDGPRIAANIRDVSERHEVDRLKKDFVSTVSHELRTPLTSIRGSLGLLTGGVAGELPPAVSKLISIAERNSVRLIALINDILDFERLESGHMEFDLKPHDGSLIVERSLESVRAFADQENVELTTELRAGAVFADADRIVQVLVNFISNAIKFSSTGGKIIVRTIPHDDYLRFEVEDFGRGIPTSALQKLFQRFQQVDASDSRRQGGTGLGLAISKAIIEQHGGVIGVESAIGEGSTFWFQIPRGEATHDEILPVLIAAKDAEEYDALRKLVPSDRISIACTDPREIWEQLSKCASSLAIIHSSYLRTDSFDLRAKLSNEYNCKRHPVIIFGDSVIFPPDLISKQVAIVVNPTSEADVLRSIRTAMTATKQGADVLLIEDDRELLTVMAAQLASEGISVRTASTAAEAIDLISRKVPELIVLDVGLPDHDGFEVVQALQSSEETRRIALLVHTGRELTEEQRGRLTLGPTRFLMKSRSDEDGFRRLVADLLNAGALQSGGIGGGTN